MGSLKIGVALWSLGQASTMEELERLLDTAAATGVKGVQPWCVDVQKWNINCVLDPDRCATPTQRAKVRKMCDKRGLTITGLCAQLHGPTTMGGFGEFDATIEARVEKTRRSLRLAADLGAPCVSTHIGPIPEERESSSYARYLKATIAVLKEAERCGTNFAMETGQEPAAAMKQFIEDIGSPKLKVNFDPANMLEQGPAESVKILAPYIVHTHAKDKHPETGKPTVGQGGVPWKEYIGALKEIGYDGWYALEDESKSPDVVESVTTGRKFLEQF